MLSVLKKYVVIDVALLEGDPDVRVKERKHRYFFYVYPNFDQAGLQNNAWVFESIPRNGSTELF